MCGISGFNWRDEERIRTMMASLSHRGPDAEGLHLDACMSIGHNRLSVIDLSSAANQPMFDSTRDLAIVFNGEIYNFREIREALENDYPWRTKSDTEVILAGYRRWGRRVVERLNGMFAFAIWDTRDRSLFCARDHAGMKPFYYYWDGKRFIFASEIPAILSHTDVPRKLNREAFNHYMRVLYTPEPTTLIEGFHKLPPAHGLLLKDGQLRVEAWCPAGTVPQTAVNETRLSYGQAVTAVRTRVLEAVERHLVADVPLGVYLSGGIDSSVVLSAMSRLRAKVKTFTVGFDLSDGGDRKKFNHDFELAAKTAEHLGSDHHPLVISPEDALDAFHEVTVKNSDPISNPTSIAMFLLARFARHEVTVVLTGNGGDELFGGYERYRLALVAELYRKLPAFVRSIGARHPQLSKLDYRSNIELFARLMFTKDDRLSEVVSRSVFVDGARAMEYFESRYAASCHADVVEWFMDTDRRSWLADHFFMLSDKMSMASALEERMPFADRDLIAFARTLPRRYKVDLWRTKKILKDAFRDDLPPFLLNQPKRGWFSPAAKWLRVPAFSRLARELLSPEYCRSTKDIFDWTGLGRMLRMHLDKQEYNLTTLWAAMTFQAWARETRIEV